MANPPRTGNFRPSPQQAVFEADSGVESAAAPVPLAAAPERFVAETWARLAALKGSGAQALAALDHPDPGMLVALRRENLALGLLEPGRRAAAEAQEAAYALTVSLVEELRALGAQGRIVARGLFAGKPSSGASRGHPRVKARGQALLPQSPSRDGRLSTPYAGEGT